MFEEKCEAVMMLGDMDMLEDALRVLFMSIRFNSPQDKQIIPSSSFRDGRSLWTRGRDFLVYFNIQKVHKSDIEYGTFFSTDSPFRNLGDCFKCLMAAFRILKKERLANRVSNADAALQYVSAAIALNGPDAKVFPSVDRLKTEGIDRLTTQQARMYCGNLIAEPTKGNVLVQVS